MSGIMSRDTGTGKDSAVTQAQFEFRSGPLASVLTGRGGGSPGRLGRDTRGCGCSQGAAETWPGALLPAPRPVLRLPHTGDLGCATGPVPRPRAGTQSGLLDPEALGECLSSTWEI